MSAISKVDKEYRLLDGAPLSYILKTGRNGKLVVFDSKKKYNRSIRHCRNEKSVFIEEQSGHAVISPVVFEKGYFTVKFSEISTQTFMDLHPGNSANGGSIFEEVNDEVEASESLEREDLVIDLKQIVREKQKEDAGIFELEALLSVLKGRLIGTEMSGSELRRELYVQIDSNPHRFVNEKGKPELFNEDIKRRHLALRCIKEGVIKLSIDGRKAMWGDSKELITNIPVGIKSSEHLAKYFDSDDGMLVLEEVLKKL